VVVALAALVAVAALSRLDQNDTFQARVSSESASGNVYVRLATYQQGLDIFRHHALIGVGPKQYGAAAMATPQRFVHGNQSVPFPHSSFVGLLAEQGLFGFVPFVCLIFAAWRLVRALGRASGVRTDGILVGAAVGVSIGYIVMSATLTMLPYGPSNAFFALFLGLVAARLNAVTAVEQSSPATLRALPARA
jgi:O-antigen ligase